jgi:Brp/Blh family beta-carotene 15,15'-monooxygenase
MINIALWFVYPAISLLFFLLISSYHFGQAQLSHHFKEKNALNNLTYLFWGNLALTSFFLFNAQEIRYYFQDFPSLKSIDFLFQPMILSQFIVLNAAGLLISSIVYLKKDQMQLEAIAIETVILLMILSIAYLFHFLFGFAIFFVLLHAIPVLIQEYSELYSRSNLKNILSFFKLLSPFSLISLIGIFGLFYLKELQIIELSYLFLILIATSSITLPHVWVMKKFYRD